MGYSPSVLRQATAQLAAQKSRHAAKQGDLQQEIYQKLPQVAQIQRKLRQTMAKVVGAALRAGGNTDSVIATIKAENLALQEESAALLLAAGYPENALDEVPLCAKCNDTGWKGNQMCDCLKLLCTQAQIRELSHLLDFGEQRFDRFNLDYYAPQFWGQWGRSPRDNMEKVLKICRDYANNFGRYYFNNLFLSGSTGLGKTFLSACIARTVSENGFSVVYDTAGNIFAQFETQKFTRDEDESREAKEGTRRYLGCDLLIMDDLGSEMTTPFVQSALYQLVNSRLVAGKRTVISSNLTMKDVTQRYSPQVSSRLDGEYRVLPFFGEDIRVLRKQGG